MELDNIYTSDGHLLSTIFEKAKRGNGKSIVLFTHGIFTDKHEKGRFDRLSLQLINNDFDTLRFDFRGHGKSPMKSSEFTVLGALEDYLTILKWCHNNYDFVHIIGSSFGGSIVLLERLVEPTSKISKIVLLNPVVDYQSTFVNAISDWGKEIFSIQKIETIFEKGEENITNDFIASKELYMQLSVICPFIAIPKIDIPCLVFHGNKDEKVPLILSERHFINTPNVHLDIVDGAGHAFKTDIYENHVHTLTVNWFLNNDNH